MRIITKKFLNVKKELTFYSKILKKCGFNDFFSEFSSDDMKIIKKYTEKTMSDFKKNIPHQQWDLIRKNDAIKLWAEFGRSEIIQEHGILIDMVDLTLENIYKILSNTLIIYQDDNYYKYYKFIADDMGHRRITDAYCNFKIPLQKLKLALSDKEKLLALDMTFNTLHSNNNDDMSNWFIQGGLQTLKLLRDMNPNWSARDL